MTTDMLVSGPTGLRLRPYAGEADVPAIVHIINAEIEYEKLPFHASVAEVLPRYRNPSPTFDPARDVTLAEIDGQVVAYGERSWVDTNEGQYREYRLDGAVLPEWRRRGIGATLLAENVRRQRELAATQPTERQEVLGSWTADRMTGAPALLTKAGFEPVRWFFEMTRDLSQPIPDVPLPDGLEFRSITPDMVRQVWLADIEAFRDHWGGFDASEESFRRFTASPSFDPTLWVVAFDGDEVAGASINAINAEENAALGIKRGWLDSVFTRRPWRRRGVAGACVARSLTAIRERGMDQGILGVDADNPTGALGVYERVGFVVAERSTAWRKPLAD